MHYVVVGAGYTGRRVLERLPHGRCQALTRPDFDLDSAAPLLPSLPRPCTVLYTVPPAPAGDDDARLERLLARPDFVPHRFVYLSTTGVYGDRQGERVDELCVPEPATGRARRRLDAEQKLQAWAASRDIELLILRVPGIYGPGRLGLDRISNGLPIIDEAEAAPGNRIHVDDLADCCVLAMSSPPAGGIYNVGDGDHRSSSWFTKAIAKLAGLTAPPEISRAEAEASFDPVRLSFLAESRIVDTTRMHEILGFTPRYRDPEDGIRASLLAKA
jgi:nucleoside-diphosphate-sugar epimerase